jgi:hypothetical protein
MSWQRYAVCTGSQNANATNVRDDTMLSLQPQPSLKDVPAQSPVSALPDSSLWSDYFVVRYSSVDRSCGHDPATAPMPAAR